MNLNMLIIDGKLQDEPIAQEDGLGNTSASVKIIHTSIFKGKEGAKDDFKSALMEIRCTGFNATALKKFYHKGDEIVVEGKLFTHSSANGMAFAYIRVSKIVFTGKKAEGTHRATRDDKPY